MKPAEKSVAFYLGSTWVEADKILIQEVVHLPRIGESLIFNSEAAGPEEARVLDVRHQLGDVTPSVEVLARWI